MTLVLCAATFFVSHAFVSPAVVAHAFQKKVKGALREKDARRAISTTNGVELPTSAVRVTSIDSTATSAEVVAGIKTAFRFRRSGEGKQSKWVVVEVRTGERRWDDLELILHALNVVARPAILTDLETLAAELEARQLRERKKNDDSKNANDDNGEQQQKTRRADVEGQSDEKQSKNESKDGESEAAANELRRGALVAKSFSALLSSATLEAEVDAGFRLVKETGSKWRVVEMRIGDSEWRSVDALVAAANADKNARARADMEVLRAALEAFRRERGFYVVAEDHAALVDHLSPRYLPRIIRFDPWHRPYKYTGTRERYVLRSDGADGKEGTADDVAYTSAS
jgi:hypothetical protein